MKIQYDQEVDALSIIFIETTVTTKHLSDSISIDYDCDGHIADIKILDAKVRFESKDIFSKVELECIGLSVA
jgi:uncharacterized protein YuzE